MTRNLASGGGAVRASSPFTVGVAQLVERQVVVLDAASSNLVTHPRLPADVKAGPGGVTRDGMGAVCKTVASAWLVRFQRPPLNRMTS